MTTKHAAALAALDAGCWAVPVDERDLSKGYVALWFDAQWSTGVVKGHGATPIDALAAAAEALGLESRYVVTERKWCDLCEKSEETDEAMYEVIDDENHTVFMCEGCHDEALADGCKGEEEKR